MMADNEEKNNINLRDNIDNFDDVNALLVNDVPSEFKLNIPEEPSEDIADTTISNHNKEVLNNLNDAKIAAINSYTEQEKERAKRQKPLLNAVLWITVIQCAFFNGIIGFTAFAIFKMNSSDIISHLLELLKWYIAATVAELIGMIAFVVRGTFSNNHIKTLKLFLAEAGENDKEENQK